MFLIRPPVFKYANIMLGWKRWKRKWKCTRNLNHNSVTLDIQVSSVLAAFTQIVNFMGPTRCPLGSCRPQMGPMLAPWTLLSGYLQFMLSDTLELTYPSFRARLYGALYSGAMISGKRARDIDVVSHMWMDIQGITRSKGLAGDFCYITVIIFVGIYPKGEPYSHMHFAYSHFGICFWSLLTVC